MKQGDQITIKATVLRVDAGFIHAQTPNGQLIQTDISNCMKEDEKLEKDEKREKLKPEKKSVPPAENKAILNAPENKSAK